MWNYPESNPRELPALVLAYIGDAVFELYVRTYLIKKTPHKVKNLHVEATKLVRAASQAEFLERLADVLTDEEKAVAKRGRNTNAGHVPKNAGVIEYRLSTGFEALLGYLFLNRQELRIQELLEDLFNDRKE